MLKYSDSYNEKIDQKLFTELCSILYPENIEKIRATMPEKPFYFLEVNENLFSDLEYINSAWDIDSFDSRNRIGIYVKDLSPYSEIVFSSDGNDIFRVTYKDRIFFVRASNLLSAFKEKVGI